MAFEKLDPVSKAALARIVEDQIENDQPFDIASGFSHNLQLVIERLQRPKTMLPVAIYGYSNADFYKQLQTPGRQMSAATFKKIAEFLGVSYDFLYQLMREPDELDSQTVRELLTEDKKDR